MRRVVLLAACLAAIATGIVHAAPVEWRVADGGNGHLYEIVPTASVTWQSARQGAIARGGYLATITSSAENEFVRNLALQDPANWFSNIYNMRYGPWLGGFQPQGSPEPNGGWRWVTEEPRSWSIWAWNQPDEWSGIHQDYVIMLDSGQWDDVQNEIWEGVRSFAVEYDPSGATRDVSAPPVPEPSSFLALFCGIGSIGGAMYRRRK